jgi:ABC-2 type transport system ATP-binding protein
MKKTLLGVDKPSRLKKDLYGSSVTVQLRSVTPAIVESLRSLSFIKDLSAKGNMLTMNIGSPDQDNPLLVKALVSLGADVQYVYENKHSLEEVYFKIMGASK